MGKTIKDEDLRLNIIVNGDKGRKEIGQLERKIKDTTLSLKGLEAEERSLRRSGKKNTQQYQAVTAAIEEHNATILKAKNRLQVLRAGVDLTKMSYTDLRKEIGRLTRLRNLSGPNSDNWKVYNERLKLVQKRFDEVRQKSQLTSLSMKNMANQFNHYIGVITAGLATLSAAIFGVRKAIDAYAEFDDKVADVQKTTGLLKSDVLELNKELQSVDTRTAQLGLLGLGRVAGKLGISSKQDVLEFVKATDQISVALTEDLGGDIEQSINDVGKLVDIFNVQDEFGIEQGLLKVGSTINELGANSTANEGYIVNFTKRTAGIAPAAKISIANIMGLGATLDMLGQSVEVSGTTFVNIIPDMFKETAEFARVAGMSVDDFTELLERDTNEALIALLEGVKGNNDGMAELVKRLEAVGVDGARATAVVSVMANNTQALREQQALANKAFKEGTSLTDEFNIKNETAAAKLEKARKGLYNMTVQLGEELMPLMTFSTSGFSYFIKVLSSLISFLKENATTLVFLTSVLATYNTIVYLSTVSLKSNIVITTAKILLDKGQRAGLILLAAAQALFTGNLTRASAAMRIFNKVTKLNPLVLLISLVVAAGAALYTYINRLKSTRSAQSALNDVIEESKKSVVDERIKVEQLIKIAKNQRLSIDQRKSAIKALNDISPKYLGGLDLEKVATEEATKATNRYVESLLKKARVEAAQQKLVELNKERLDIGKNADVGIADYLKVGMKSIVDTYKFKGTLIENYIRNSVVAGNKLYSEEIKKFEEQEKALMDFIQDNSDQYVELVKKTPVVGGVTPLTDADQKEIDDRKAKMEEFRKSVLDSTRSAVEVEKAAYEERLIQAGIFNKKFESMTLEDHQIEYALLKQHEANLAKLDAEAIENEISRFNDSLQSQLNLLKTSQNEELKAFKGTKEQREQLIKDQTAAEEELVSQNLEKLQSLIELTLDTGSWEGITADDVLSDEELKILQDKLEEVGLSLSSLGSDQSSDESQDQTDKVDLGFGSTDILGMSPEDWDGFFENLKNGKLGIEEMIFAAQAFTEAMKMHNSYVSEAERRNLEQFERNTEQKKASIETRMNRELEAAEGNTRKQEEIKKKYNRGLLKLETDLDKKKAEFDYNEAKRGKSTALMSAIVNTAAAIAQALPNVALSILAGTIGAIQIGTIASTPLPEIPGREDGGYLVQRSQDRKMFRANVDYKKRGYIDKPTVLAGENGREFVASNQAYNNPTIRPVLDYIDTAQRNGTINTVRLDKILKDRPAIRKHEGRENGGYINAPKSGNSDSGHDLKALIKESNNLNRRLANRLDKGIRSEVSLVGKGGFNEAQDELEDINNNVNL